MMTRMNVTAGTRSASEQMRALMSRLAGGVVIVSAAGGDGHPAATTATAVCSVSLEPPLALVCLSRTSRTLASALEAGSFAMSMLAEDGVWLAERLARTGSDKADNVPWKTTEGGVPVPAAATMATAEFAVQRAIPAGDHVILLGLLAGGEATGDDAPLVHFRRRYLVAERPVG